MKRKEHTYLVLLAAAVTMLVLPSVAAETYHDAETYQEESDGTDLVAASTWWFHETYRGQTVHRAYGGHTSIGLPGTGSLFLCGTETYCSGVDDRKDTCAIPEDSPLGSPTYCQTKSPFVYLGCVYSWARTTNSASMSADSLIGNTGSNHCA